MEKMKPKLFSVMKQYDKKQFGSDIMAGMIVAIIALPLSIAFALGSGVSAERGIYSAVISSIIIAILGGSRVQITGPTGAFIIITQSIISSYGMNGLMIAMVMAGLMLIAMGLLKLGRFVKFIPAPITIGFTGGIAITIFTLEVKDFLGITIEQMPSNFFAKWGVYLSHLTDINYQSFLLGTLCILILILWPKINSVIPNSLIALIVGTLVAYVADLDVKTLGEIPTTLTVAPITKVSLEEGFALTRPAFTIAILVGLQALLSAVVTDGMINSKHRANMELVGQGVANCLLGILGCIPATGGVARSIANCKNGARTPIAGMIHGITLFLFLLVGMPLIKHVPLCTLAAILIVVAYHMFNLKAFLAYRKAPKSDIAVLLVSCVLTFAFDLILAIEVGIVLACVLFMKRMADVTEIKSWKYINRMESIDEENDTESIHLREVPENTLVFEVSGPMFFGAKDKFVQLSNQIHDGVRVVILRMRSVPAIDATALNSLNKMHKELREDHITLILSHVLEQPMQAMDKDGLLKEIGEDNICPNIDSALARANEITKRFNQIQIQSLGCYGNS